MKKRKKFNPLPGVSMPLAWLLLFLFSPDITAKNSDPEYVEIYISLHVDRLGDSEIPAMISGESNIHLSIIDVFNFLKIKTTASVSSGSASGFILNGENSYHIDASAHRITYQKKSYQLNKEDLIQTSTGLFLQLDYFKTIFGLPCTFNFRSLSVQMHPTMELPAIREMRLEKMRMNIRAIQKNDIADTTIGKSHTGFRIGAIDWSLNTLQQLHGSNTTRAHVQIGGTLAGGELGVQLNYSNNHPFLERQQRYFWRYVNNDARTLRQITVGKIQTASTSTLLDQVIGVQLSNVPTFRNASFGTFSYSNYTAPGWVVELYVNNLLVNYTTADASGFYVFNIPLSYGNTEAVLRCYGPWGEEKVSKVLFNIPFNFLPVNEFEYTVSTGIVQDAFHSRFSQARMNYGVSRHLTLGGGVEYLSSVSGNNPMPFVNTSFSITPNLIFTGEYTYGVRSQGKLSYRSPSDLQVEFSHVVYEEGQTAVRYNYRRESGVALGKRFRLFNIPFFSRLTIAQNLLQTSPATHVNFLFSGSFRNASVNIATYALYKSETAPVMYTHVSSSFMLPWRTIIGSQVRYAHDEKKIGFVQLGIKKNIANRATIHTTFERDLVTRRNTFQAGFSYNFSFARLEVGTHHYKTSHGLSVLANGSITIEPSSNYHRFNRSQAVGRGGLILSPFLDLNRNGKRDASERKVKGLRVNGNGGRMETNEDAGTIIISGLEPFTHYFVQLDQSGFESISWHLEKSSMRIEIEPNQMKLIEIPVVVLGEASGMINFAEGNEQRGMGRLKVNFYDENHKLAGSTVSESDGFFSYMGLAPGNYYAKPDSAQLELLQMTPDPVLQRFNIERSDEGDFEDQLLFILRKKGTEAGE